MWFYSEVTVQSFDLMPCNQNDKVCVTAAADCVLPPAPSAHGESGFVPCW